MLGEDQRRHLATHLQLLTDDMTALERDSAGFDRVRDLARQIAAAAGALSAAFDLRAGTRPTLRRRVQAVAGVWRARVLDLLARRLKGYGPVDPGLAERLDPHVHRLETLLIALGGAAAELPDA